MNTSNILSTIGETDADTVFTSIAVQHLSWTVLKYYYPDNEIVEGYPTYVGFLQRQIKNVAGVRGSFFKMDH